MADIDLKTLLGRLDKTTTKALEAAAGWCVSRTNYEIGVEHLLHALLQNPATDVVQILARFEIDPIRLERALVEILEDQRTGNSGRPVFSPILL
jgi:type VI secretion system protein VasG